MTRLIAWSSLIYGRLLRVCPPELRRDFGPEMVLVFTDDLADCTAEAGVCGFLRTWRRAVLDLSAIALRAAAESNSVRVPCLSCVLSALGFFAQGSRTPEILLWPSLTAGAVSFIAVQTCARTTRVSIPFDPAERASCSRC